MGFFFFFSLAPTPLSWCTSLFTEDHHHSSKPPHHWVWPVSTFHCSQNQPQNSPDWKMQTTNHGLKIDRKQWHVETGHIQAKGKGPSNVSTETRCISLSNETIEYHYHTYKLGYHMLIALCIKEYPIPYLEVWKIWTSLRFTAITIPSELRNGIAKINYIGVPVDTHARAQKSQTESC